MGADLYVWCEEFRKWDEMMEEYLDVRDESIADEAHKIYEELEKNGMYFRDSYNMTNLLWWLGLNYGRWFAQFENEDDIVPPEKCKEIKEIVLQRAENIKHTKEQKEKYEQAFGSYQRAKQYFDEKLKEFVKFLDKCIEYGGMYASY